jgi:hypothetical protein
MGYEIQKIVLKNCNVYTFLFESKIIGYILDNENSKILIQTTETPIIPIAESFGFSGNFLISDSYSNYNLVKLEESEFNINPQNFKVVNLIEYSLSEKDSLI